MASLLNKEAFLFWLCAELIMNNDVHQAAFNGIQ
jgi:hypothetical protein